MIVCVCKAVNDRTIRRAVAEGHDTFDALQFELGIGTCCGKCVPMACEVLCEARLAEREYAVGTLTRSPHRHTVQAANESRAAVMA